MKIKQRKVWDKLELWVWLLILLKWNWSNVEVSAFQNKSILNIFPQTWQKGFNIFHRIEKMIKTDAMVWNAWSMHANSELVGNHLFVDDWCKTAETYFTTWICIQDLIVQIKHKKNFRITGSCLCLGSSIFPVSKQNCFLHVMLSQAVAQTRYSVCSGTFLSARI